MRNNLSILLLFLISMVMYGCQTTTTYYQGAKADADGVVSLLAGKIEQQQWQDLNVTIDYNLSNNGDNLEIEGTLSFSASPKGNYNRVDDLKLKLFLLDRDMRVVTYKDIARVLSYNLDDKTAFTKTLQLRKGIVSYTFGYEGRFVDDDPESSSSARVWMLPKRQ
ncbi:MAG: hypothetical protein KAU22_12075 [Desulfuromonadales bacterium]|nr:hypothetical protein [Desulfuromonadales bacterium]